MHGGAKRRASTHALSKLEDRTVMHFCMIPPVALWELELIMQVFTWLCLSSSVLLFWPLKLH